MNYRHIYHAGNFTEVVKHCVLTIILDYLHNKSTPFCYIDTHAGEGIYDLTSAAAQKTGEADNGVQRIITGVHPEYMQTYLHALKPYQRGGKLIRYPGSPLFAYQLCRPQDQMILNEFHPEINRRLKQSFYNQSQVAIHQRDAYELLPGILPPPAGRGVVLIDPPFEQKDEYEKIKSTLGKCLKRWAHGIYVVWYPMTGRNAWDLHAVARDNSVEHYLIAQLTITSKNSVDSGLRGCKLLIINPPWKLAEVLDPLLKHLWEIFSVDHGGRWSVKRENV